MKYVIEIDSDDILKYAKRISIGLMIFAILLFLVLSGVIFKYSQEHSLEYDFRVKQLNTSGQVVASSMRKTGEVEDSILNNKNAFRNTKKNNKKNAFFDSVSNNHKSDKK